MIWGADGDPFLFIWLKSNPDSKITGSFKFKGTGRVLFFRKTAQRGLKNLDAVIGEVSSFHPNERFDKIIFNRDV